MFGFYYYGKSFLHEYKFDGINYIHTITGLDCIYTCSYVCTKKEFYERLKKVKKGILKTVVL